jgi:hypothetical protein
MISILNHVGIVALFLLASNAWAEKSKVILFLNLMPSRTYLDSRNTSFQPINFHSLADFEIEELTSKIRKKFPDRRIVVIEAFTPQSLEEQLRSELSPNEEVSHLWLSSHGRSFPDPNFSSLNSGKTDVQVFTSPLDYISFAVSPESDAYSVQHAQLENEGDTEPLVQQDTRPLPIPFSEDARAVLTSCKLLSGSKDLAQTKAQCLIRGLELVNGHLYANHLSGGTFPFVIPFWKYPESTDQKIVASIQLTFSWFGLTSIYQVITGKKIWQQVLPKKYAFNFAPRTIRKDGLIHLAIMTVFLAYRYFSVTGKVNQGYQVQVRDKKITQLTPMTYSDALDEWTAVQ